MDEFDVTDDAFLGGKLQILQPAKGYRAGQDAVLLAAAVSVQPEKPSRILDAGSGVGVVGLSVAVRCSNTQITLVELDPLLADLARRNVDRNGLADRAHVVEADIASGGRTLHAANRPDKMFPGTFDHLVTNPPYYAIGSGTPPPGRIKARAHQMTEGGLDRWIAFLATAGSANAGLTLIHRADALTAVLAALGSRFGCIRILPIHSRAETPATRIIVTAIKGSRAPLQLRPALILHDQENRRTPQLEAVMRHGAPLETGL